MGRGGERVLGVLSEWGSETNGIRFVCCKTVVRHKTSSLVVTKTNLIPSDSLTHAEGGMASDGSESVSSRPTTPLTTLRVTVRESMTGTTSSKLSKTEWQHPKRGA